MTSRHLLDPQLAPLLELAPAARFTDETLPKIREIRAKAAITPKIPDEVIVETFHAPGLGDAPPVRMLVSRRREVSGKQPVILHLHGGGYVLGDPEGSLIYCMGWAKRFGALVCSVDYRLAPETHAPGNVEDGYAALTWLYENADMLGIDTARIAVAGESAGGGLAAALALMVRDKGEYAFCYQHLVFPMIDDRTVVRADLSETYGEFVWTRASNGFGWRALLGHEPGLADVSPYAAPARAEDLSGLPPTFIATGAMDLFVEEDLEYARRLMGAGVPVELHVYPGAPHAYMWVADAEVSKQSFRDAELAMRRGLKVDQG